MTAEPLAFVLHYVRQRADAESLAALSDSQLLERFASRRDDAAFAALVERYGGLVWGACRRLLGDTQEAEDAFQATLLVLARRAEYLDRRGPLGGWLHTVAHRIALKARADAGRRREHERRAITATVGPHEGTDWDEVRPVLDEELQRLPAKYRLPLVLCYLEGKTNAQAAAELGWPPGSMSRRLERAREMLREGLARRGLGLSGVVLGTVLAAEARAAVPTTLLAAAARGAVTLGHGRTLVAGAVSERAIAWAEALLRKILMTKVKVVAAVLSTLVLAGGVLLAQRAVSEEPGGRPKPPAPVAAADAEPPPVEPGRGGGVPVRLRNGDVPVGSLGYPLGDSLTVEGTRPEGQKVEARTLLIDMVNGMKLKEPTAITVENVRELPKGTRIVLKGYETGRMDGPVPAAIQAAEEKGEDVLLPQRGWQWNAYFVALAAEPKVEIREEKTGFKTAKQKPSEAEKDR